MLFVSAVGNIRQFRHKKKLLGKTIPRFPLLKEHLVALEELCMNFHSNFQEVLLLWISFIFIAD